jgi:hypothetical protein
VVACVPDSPVFLVIVGNVVASSGRVTSFFFFLPFSTSFLNALLRASVWLPSVTIHPSKNHFLKDVDSLQ